MKRPAVKDHFSNLGELQKEFLSSPKLYAYAQALDNYIDELLPKKKVYIAGKITGIEDCAPYLFESAAHWVINRGHEAVNPMKLDHNHDKSWESYMKVCLKALIDCDAIYMIDNWRDSKGAVAEYNLAIILGIEILEEEHSSKS